MKTGIKFFLGIVFLFVCAICHAQSTLTTFSFKTKYGQLSVRYNTSLATLINESLGDPEWDAGTLRVLETRLSPKSSQIYVLQFDGGPSFEPKFQVFKKTAYSMDLLGDIIGRNVSVPGDGLIYLSGGKGKRRYKISQGQLTEIKKGN